MFTQLSHSKWPVACLGAINGQNGISIFASWADYLIERLVVGNHFNYNLFTSFCVVNGVKQVLTNEWLLNSLYGFLCCGNIGVTDLRWCWILNILIKLC